MKVLFLDDRNMFEGTNPKADLLEIFNATESVMRELEKSQRGVRRRGGKWVEILLDGNIKYTYISGGRKSDYSENEYDLEYKLISGNY